MSPSRASIAVGRFFPFGKSDGVCMAAASTSGEAAAVAGGMAFWNWGSASPSPKQTPPGQRQLGRGSLQLCCRRRRRRMECARCSERVQVIPSALEPVEELLIVSLPLTADPVRSVAAFAAKSGLKLDALKADLPCDQWMQDAIELGVMAFPTAVGPEQARAALTGIRKESNRSAARLDYQIARRLRRHGVVTVAPGSPRKKSRWIDWYGNLEATPPFTDRQGHRFRYGRLITGKQGELSMHPGVLRFLEAQGVQWPPIVVDTSWLAIGHVDEVVNFVPAKTRAGFKVLLPSPKTARELLDSLVAEGMDEVSVFAGTEDSITVVKLRLTVAGSSENLAIDEAVERIRARSEDRISPDAFGASLCSRWRFSAAVALR